MSPEAWTLPWEEAREGLVVHRDRQVVYLNPAAAELLAVDREKVPQELRVWLRYRSEKYFGEHRTPPGRANG